MSDRNDTEMIKKEKNQSRLEKRIQEEIWNTVIDKNSEELKRKKLSDLEEENIRKLIKITDLPGDKIRYIAFRVRKKILADEEKKMKKKEKPEKTRKIKVKNIVSWIISISILCTTVFLIGQCIKNSIDGKKLCEAAEYGNYDRIKILLDRGANINAKDYIDRTALMIAAESDYPAIVELLVKRGANLKSRDMYKRRAIDYAEKNYHQEIIDILGIAYAESTPPDSVVRKLIEMGYPFSNESFHDAVRDKNLKAVELFLSEGMDPLDDYDHYQSALEAAVSDNNPEMVLLLLSKIPKKTTEPVASAFHEAVDNGNIEIIRILTSWGINLKQLIRFEIYPLLDTRDYETMKLLLENGMNINIRDKHGKSTLLMAVTEHEIPESERVVLVNLLLEYGADPNVSDQNGRLIDQAVELGNTEIIQLLYQAGAEE